MEVIEKIPVAIAEGTDPTQIKDFLIVKTANQWLKRQQGRYQKMLFSELWHWRGICILFALPVRQSILAVQSGNSISTVEPIQALKMTISQTVLYFDFELSNKQFEGRYSAEFKNHFEFDDILSGSS